MPKDFSQDLPALLGKEIDHADVKRFLKKLDSGEAVTLSSLKEPRWASEQAGVAINAAPKSGRITDVFLFAEGHEDNQQYQGALPHGLDFSMGMKEVKACFPRKPDFHSEEHATWDFDDYRLVVSFEDNAIASVYLSSDF
jgi:hypothetical protein